MQVNYLSQLDAMEPSDDQVVLPKPTPSQGSFLQTKEEGLRCHYHPAYLRYRTALKRINEGLSP